MAKDKEKDKEKSGGKKEFEALSERLVHLHRALYAEQKQALLIVLQARDAAGKDSLIKKVFGPLDPHDFQVYAFKKPEGVELQRDYLWRVHLRVPRKGSIVIFNRSHYEEVLPVRVYGLVPREVWEKRYDHINDFERYLVDNGVTILKIFLDTSKEEQRKQLLERIEDPEKNWKWNAGDLKDRERWDDFTAAYEELLKRCNTEWAPWHVVPGDDRKARNVLVARLVVETLERMNPQLPKAGTGLDQYRSQLS